MEETQHRQSNDSALEVLKEKLSRGQPGMMFTEPVTKGDHTVILANQVLVSKDQVRVKPRAVIVIGPRGVKVRRFYPPLLEAFYRISMLGLLVSAPGLIFFPPWHPDNDLIGRVNELLKTIFNK